MDSNKLVSARVGAGFSESFFLSPDVSATVSFSCLCSAEDATLLASTSLVLHVLRDRLALKEGNVCSGQWNTRNEDASFNQDTQIKCTNSLKRGHIFNKY